MSDPQPNPALFAHATATLQADTRRDDLTIHPLDEAARLEVSQRWQELTARAPLASEHKDRDISYLIRSLDGRHRHTPSCGLWHGDRLIATTLIDINDYHYKSFLTVAHIAGSPEPHALKGRLIGALHRVFAGMAGLRGDSWVRYIGTYSTGSMKQFERGAVPLSTLARQRMWEGYNIDVAIAPAAHETMHVLGSPPPATISRCYHEAYRQLFGRDYKRPA